MNEKILIVDDEPDVLKILQNILSVEDYRVKSASGGKEAISLFQAESFDLVITDIRMPEMDGLEVMQRVKELDENIEVLILTGYASLENAIQALKENGAFDYLSKPLEDMEILLFAVKRALEKRRLRIKNRNLFDELKRKKSELETMNEQLRKEIKDRQQAETALRESEAKYRLLTENIDDVIWTLDMNMDITYVSPVVHRLQGFRVDEMISHNINEFLPPESKDQVQKIFEQNYLQAEKSGNFDFSKTFEIQAKRKDGSHVWTEVTASFTLAENGKPLGILGITRDITERRKTLQEKEELEEKLNRLRKMEALGLLAGGVAHDLNNVLSGIVSYPDLLLLKLPDDSPLKNPIKTIKKSGLKAAAIVQDLLTLARRSVITKEILNLNSLVREYLRSPEQESLGLYHPNVRIGINFEKDLPNIEGSSVHLKKTLMNLVLNALEAQPNGGVITISTKSLYLDKPVKGYDRLEEGDYVVLSIDDRGEGISPEDLPRIFEPFYTKKVMGRSGTGLGMAVIWGTVQDHQGYIDILSTEGKGTKFDLYFPMTQQRVTEEKGAVSIDEYFGNKETILVVDDIKEQREIAIEVLESLNYRVTAVSSGEEAVESVKNQPVNLILLDMIMDPGIDGLETYKRILEINRKQKAVIASGFSETQRVKEAQQLGAGQYIKKPYTIEKIARAIKIELTQRENS